MSLQRILRVSNNSRLYFAVASEEGAVSVSFIINAWGHPGERGGLPDLPNPTAELLAYHRPREAVEGWAETCSWLNRPCEEEVSYLDAEPFQELLFEDCDEGVFLELERLHRARWEP